GKKRNPDRRVRPRQAPDRPPADRRGRPRRSPPALSPHPDDVFRVHTRSDSPHARQRRGFGGAPFLGHGGIQRHAGRDGAGGTIRPSALRGRGTARRADSWGRSPTCHEVRSTRRAASGAGRMNRLSAATLCVLLLSTGCGAVRYPRPAVTVPATYRGEEPSGAHYESLGELRWEDLIRDEELAQFIREALANNYDAQIAAARVLEARAQFGMSRSALFPSVDAEAGYNNLRSSENSAAPIAGGFSTEIDYTSVSAGLAWEIDSWGRIRNANAAARAALL